MAVSPFEQLLINQIIGKSNQKQNEDAINLVNAGITAGSNIRPPRVTQGSNVTMQLPGSLGKTGQLIHSTFNQAQPGGFAELDPNMSSPNPNVRLPEPETADVTMNLPGSLGKTGRFINDTFNPQPSNLVERKPSYNLSYLNKDPASLPSPYKYNRTWENTSVPQGSPAPAPAVASPSQASSFDTSVENYYRLANAGKLGKGKDRLNEWIKLGGDKESYLAGQKYLNSMYAKSYAKGKVKEKANTSTAPRPTPQEVRARKAQQDEMLRQSMLNTAQNPNSSVRRNMPDYYNSSTTLQNYYLTNPDLWGNR